MEYLIETMNINQTEVSSISMIDCIDQILTVANSLLALVVIIIGISWLKPLKEKQNSASFTFWSQFRVRILKIHSYFKSNDKCLFYLYDSTARKNWTSILAPNPDEFKELKETINEMLIFLQSASDQMPPYNGWTDDYTKFLDYITDIITYDICNSTDKFKFKDPVDYSELSILQNSICLLIETMCTNIENKQKFIEDKITTTWYSRIWRAIKSSNDR